MCGVRRARCHFCLPSTGTHSGGIPRNGTRVLFVSPCFVTVASVLVEAGEPPL